MPLPPLLHACQHPYKPARMKAASALRPAKLASKPAPSRRVCAPRPGLSRPSITVAATPDPSKGSGQLQAAASVAATAAIAAGLLLAHSGPVLAEDGGRRAVVITSPPALEFPGQLDAAAAQRAPTLRTAPQAAAVAGTTDVAQASWPFAMLLPPCRAIGLSQLLCRQSLQLYTVDTYSARAEGRMLSGPCNLGLHLAPPPSADVARPERCPAQPPG